MKTNMTKGQKKFYYDKAIRTYEREINNTSGRIEGLKVIAKEAIDNKDLELLAKTKKKIDVLIGDGIIMCEELERIKSEYVKLFGVAV